MNKSIEEKNQWWEDNHQKLIDLEIPYENWLSIIKNKKDFDGVYNSTAKHRALYLLHTYTIQELEDLINEYGEDE